MKSCIAVLARFQSQFRLLPLVSILVVLGGSSAIARDISQCEIDRTKNERPRHASSDTLTDISCIPFPTLYGIQQTGNLDAHFDSYGVFGTGWNNYGYYSLWPEASFQTPSEFNIEYLFGGSIWIGGRIGSDTLVSVGVDGWQLAPEMWPPTVNNSYVSTIKPFSSSAGFSLWSETTDTNSFMPYPNDVILGRPHRPFPISIVNRSHVWRSSESRDIVIYDMLVRNEGGGTIEDGYIGFYFDCDVGHEVSGSPWDDDLAGSLRSEGIAYIIDDDGDPVGGQFVSNTSPTKIFAFKLLASSFTVTDTSFHWWLSNVDPSLDFGPTRIDSLGNPLYCDFGTGGTGTPEGDLNKYCLLSSGEWDYDMIYVGREADMDSAWMPPPISWEITTDARFLLSFGPFELEPDSVLRLVFSTFSADSVHVDPTNLSRLGIHPDSFLTHLNFDNVIANAGVADSLSQQLLDPLSPPSGLRLTDPYGIVSCAPEVEWDPHVFAGIDEYEVYAWEIPEDSIPYPGVIPPWLESPQLQLHDVVGNGTKYQFAPMDCNKSYLVNVAAKAGGQTGLPSSKLVLDRTYRPSPLVIANSTGGKLFVEQGEVPYLVWRAPAYPVDHYNIYRVVGSTPFPHYYYPFYDRGCDTLRTPVDSFDISGEMHYYYSMTPSVTIAGEDTVYVDPVAVQDQWYLLTAVDSSGLESKFAMARTTIVDPPNDKALVLIGPPSAFHKYSAVSAFYDSVMGLAGLAYDLMSLGTVPLVTPEFLYPYSMVIVDDNLSDPQFARTVEEASNYLVYTYLKRKLAYFGSFNQPGTGPYSAPMSRPLTGLFQQIMFNVDSVYTYGFAYCDGVTPICSHDSLKFAAAIAQDSLFPTITTDTNRSVFTSLVQTYWENDSPPSVATFHISPFFGNSVDTLYAFEGVEPASAVQQGGLIGLRNDYGLGAAHLFGFHLWYMKQGEAASLIRAIIDSTSGLEYCCRGLAGNVSDDYLDVLDIVDLTYLVCYMFKDCDPPRCYDEANIIDNANNLIDIVDLTYLVAFMFKGGPPPQACPAWPPLLKNP